MGQSSLGQAQPVLPVVSQQAGAAARPLPTQRKNPQALPEGHTYCNQGPPLQQQQPTLLQSATAAADGKAKKEDDTVKVRPESQVRRHGVRGSVISLRDNPMYGDETVGAGGDKAKGGGGCTALGAVEQRESREGSEPPTPPPRRYLSDEVRTFFMWHWNSLCIFHLQQLMLHHQIHEYESY